MIEPEMPREISRDVAEHEVLISFPMDYHAEIFMDWWDVSGLNDFNKFLEGSKRKYSN